MSADPPDPLLAFPDFTAAVGERLEAGAQAYGDRSFGLHPTQLLDELQQEALDLAGWGYVIWKRLQAAQEAAGRLTPKREPMVYHAAGGEGRKGIEAKGGGLMAYLRTLSITCDSPGCRSRATVELVNHVNAPSGRYCRTHGKTRLADLTRRERPPTTKPSKGSPF